MTKLSTPEFRGSVRDLVRLFVVEDSDDRPLYTMSGDSVADVLSGIWQIMGFANVPDGLEAALVRKGTCLHDGIRYELRWGLVGFNERAWMESVDDLEPTYADIPPDGYDCYRHAHERLHDGVPDPKAQYQVAVLSTNEDYVTLHLSSGATLGDAIRLMNGEVNMDINACFRALHAGHVYREKKSWRHEVEAHVLPQSHELLIKAVRAVSIVGEVTAE